MKPEAAESTNGIDGVQGRVPAAKYASTANEQPTAVQKRHTGNEHKANPEDKRAGAKQASETRKRKRERTCGKESVDGERAAHGGPEVAQRGPGLAVLEEGQHLFVDKQQDNRKLVQLRVLSDWLSGREWSIAEQASV
jgi:hypothetical protein